MSVKRTLALALTLVFASCVHLPKLARTPRPAPPPRRPTLTVALAAPTTLEAEVPRVAVVAPREPVEAVVVVTLDGVRWQEIFEGTKELHSRDEKIPERTAAELLPTLSRWANDDGASVGAPGTGEMRASGPDYLSLPGYTEIMTGRPPTDCQSNFCGIVKQRTMMDESRDAFPTERVALVSSWDSIAYAASPTLRGLEWSAGRVRSSGVQDAWLEPARHANAWPGDGEYRADAYTMKVALKVLETDRPKLLFIGLGDTDEHAHHGDLANYVGALRAADAFLGTLEAALETMGERGKHTAILVTCDHGRSAGFREHGGGALESGRVWLIGKGAGIVDSGKVETSGVRLADVAPTVRALLDLPRDEDERAGAPVEAILER